MGKIIVTCQKCQKNIHFEKIANGSCSISCPKCKDVFFIKNLIADTVENPTQLNSGGKWIYQYSNGDIRTGLSVGSKNPLIFLYVFFLAFYIYFQPIEFIIYWYFYDNVPLLATGMLMVMISWIVLLVSATIGTFYGKMEFNISSESYLFLGVGKQGTKKKFKWDEIINVTVDNDSRKIYLHGENGVKPIEIKVNSNFRDKEKKEFFSLALNYLCKNKEIHRQVPLFDPESPHIQPQKKLSKNEIYDFIKKHKIKTAVISVIAITSLTLLIVSRDGEYKTRRLPDRTLEIVRYRGNANEVFIPAEINGIPVTSLGSFSRIDFRGIIRRARLESITESAFENKQLVSVVIPDSVTNIGDYAFLNNQLTSVIIPDSVVTIGRAAFSRNQLASVVIPDSVISIGCYAFLGNLLTSLVIPDSVTFLGEYAFASNRLTDLVISNRIRTIARGTFSGNRLTDLVIPDSVINIGQWAFRGNQLASVTVGNSVAFIDERAFWGNQLVSVAIPDNVIWIDDEVFGRNPLSNLDIGSGVRFILARAFRETQLTLEGITINEGERRMAPGHRFHEQFEMGQRSGRYRLKEVDLDEYGDLFGWVLERSWSERFEWLHELFKAKDLEAN